MVITDFIKNMKKEGWDPSGGWKPEDLDGVPPGGYDVEFKDTNEKIILVKGSTIMSLHTGTFSEWQREMNRAAYKTNFIQIF